MGERAGKDALFAAGLVDSRRDGKRIFYSLTGDDVAGLWESVRRVAQAHRPHTELARRAYLGPEDTEAVSTEELLRRLDRGHAVVLDVRPVPEYVGGHLAGAVHIPLEELADRLAELPGGREVVAYCRGQYCVLAHDAVRLLNPGGAAPDGPPRVSWSGAWPVFRSRPALLEVAPETEDPSPAHSCLCAIASTMPGGEYGRGTRPTRPRVFIPRESHEQLD